VLDTSGSATQPGVYTKANDFSKKHREQATPDFLPTSASIPEGSTDVQDPKATTGGSQDVFKGAPDTGTKGGPAVPGHD